LNEVVEGVVIEIIRWADGKGADVRMHDDESKYYYIGEMKIPLGRAVQMETKDGAGKFKGKLEIISCEELRQNPDNPLPSMPDPQKKQPMPVIQMPLSEFKYLLEQKSLLRGTRVIALESAINLIAALHVSERDPKAAARLATDIAEELEAFIE